VCKKRKYFGTFLDKKKNEETKFGVRTNEELRRLFGEANES